MKKYELQLILNQQGIPDMEKKSNGGLVPDFAQYGTWLKNNNPSRFNAILQAS
jgi:hypothetical protein